MAPVCFVVSNITFPKSFIKKAILEAGLDIQDHEINYGGGGKDNVGKRGKAWVCLHRHSHHDAIKGAFFVMGKVGDHPQPSAHKLRGPLPNHASKVVDRKASWPHVSSNKVAAILRRYIEAYDKERALEASDW